MEPRCVTSVTTTEAGRGGVNEMNIGVPGGSRLLVEFEVVLFLVLLQ